MPKQTSSHKLNNIRIPRKTNSRQTGYNYRNKTTTNTLLAQNKYFTLSSDEEEVEMADNTNSSSRSKRATSSRINTKPPPIIITDTRYNKIELILDETNIKIYNYKQIALGIKIFLQSKEDFDSLIATLKGKEVEFYTHRYSEEKILKVVLYGLPQMDIEELKAHFTSESNIKPTNIFQMKTKTNNIHNATYLIHLNKNDLTYNDILKIKSINHTLIKWAHYKPKFKGPTLCNKCSSYGHGAQNCNRTAHCTLCAGEHESKDCTLKTNENTTSIVYKCFNCSINNKPSNHKANDEQCPFRLHYLEIKNRANNRHRQIQPNTLYHKTRTPQTQTTQTTQTAQRIPNITNKLPLSYADQLKNLPQANDENNDEELFSISELLNIFKNAVSKIKQCRTKLDQISVIASLLEYAI